MPSNWLAGVVARVVTEPVEVSSLCGGGYSPFEARSPRGRWRGLFESLLAEAFS